MGSVSEVCGRSVHTLPIALCFAAPMLCQSTNLCAVDPPNQGHPEVNRPRWMDFFAFERDFVDLVVPPVLRWHPEIDRQHKTRLYAIASDASPIRLTHFDTEPSSVVAWVWSRDGKKIAITGACFNDTDVVLFSGFR